MMKNLTQKDISFLNSVVGTNGEHGKLNAYIEAHAKAVEAYEDFINEVLAGKAIAKLNTETLGSKANLPEEKLKAVKPIKNKRSFKVGDKVKLTDKGLPDVLQFFSKDVVFVITETTKHEDGVYPSKLKIESVNSKESHVVFFHSNHNGKIYDYFEKVSEPKSSTTESNVNKKRKEMINNALKYITKRELELLSSGMKYSQSSITTNDNKTITVKVKDTNSGMVLKESQAVCSNQYVFNGYIGVAIGLSKLLNDQEAYDYFSNTPQPTIALDQYAVLDAKLSKAKHLDATFVLPAEDSDYVMLDGIKIKKGRAPEGVYRIISDDIAIY